jgi:hypothetical protein
MSNSDKFPGLAELASTDNFQVWMDREDGEITVAFLARGFTVSLGWDESVSLGWDELDELVGVLTQARARIRR